MHGGIGDGAKDKGFNTASLSYSTGTWPWIDILAITWSLRASLLCVVLSQQVYEDVGR